MGFFRNRSQNSVTPDGYKFLKFWSNIDNRLFCQSLYGLQMIKLGCVNVLSWVRSNILVINGFNFFVVKMYLKNKIILLKK